MAVDGGQRAAEWVGVDAIADVVQDAQAFADEGGLEEGVFAGPVQVHGAFGDAGRAGDLVDAGLVEAEAGEESRGGVKQTRLAPRPGALSSFDR